MLAACPGNFGRRLGARLDGHGPVPGLAGEAHALNAVGDACRDGGHHKTVFGERQGVLGGRHPHGIGFREAGGRPPRGGRPKARRVERVVAVPGRVDDLAPLASLGDRLHRRVKRELAKQRSAEPRRESYVMGRTSHVRKCVADHSDLLSSGVIRPTHRGRRNHPCGNRGPIPVA